MNTEIFFDSNINQWVSALGYAGVVAIIFSETAFFFCFILPGDSLLITAGVLAANHLFDIYILLPLLITASFVGYWVAYWIGYYFENWLSTHDDSWYYKKSYENNARIFMQKQGKKALLYGRLIPVARTFIPLVAGMVKMPLGIYGLYNFLGAVLWGGGVTLLGYYVGGIIPGLSDYLWIAVLIIIFVSILPGMIRWAKIRWQK